MASKSQREYETEVKSWGFPMSSRGPTDRKSRPFQPPSRPCEADKDRSNAHYSPHSHHGLTTHLILRGQLTITYPADARPEKKTYSVGDRIDVEAGRVHEVWVGREGCTYVIGE
ncbi:uncharacterized protein JN550_002019 [Neoarthrinium moseri]|uniref:uncharacterized protein n=1 Tax=Neoarthrinium moseri TaxID=1658444 RepID=UPI001FDC1933|nr:uncharacterized protein JN550_002019 [Neoarthrinium moseri]KAI1875733.1 hypothetical protein JN550_002019 [Neoarthrinium moseri]